MLWLVWCSFQTTNTFSTSAVRLFHLIICTVTGLTLLISFKNSFTFPTWLTGQRPNFQPVSAFHMPSSLTLITSSFGFKGMCDSFLSLEHLEVTEGLLIGLISKLLCPGTFLVVHWLRICRLMQRTWVWSLARELRSHIPATKPARYSYWARAMQKNILSVATKTQRSQK